MTHAAKLRGVSKRFGTTTVLDDVSVDFADGTTTAVVGESGSGKTTLLRLVNALHAADAGAVEVFGEPVPRERGQVEAFRRRIGYAVQGAGLFPHLDNRANVTLLARLEGWSADAIEARFNELLEEMDLPVEVARRYPAELSGGQQQRVGLCRALMLRPALLLLDEPFSAIDPITRVGLYDVFRRVQVQEGVSTLLVTHDMREAVRLASRIVIVREGRIVQQGAVREVLDAPAHEYVERLVKEQL